MIVLSVLYPKTAGARFDYDYYMTKHIPLADRLLGPFGMTGARVLRGAAAPGGGEPAYEVITLLDFTSLEAMHAAMEKHGAEVTGDVPNATDIEPILQVNEVLL